MSSRRWRWLVCTLVVGGSLSACGSDAAERPSQSPAPPPNAPPAVPPAGPPVAADDPIALTAGAASSTMQCAITGDHRARCWGTLATDVLPGEPTVPTLVQGLDAVEEIAITWSVACARRTDRTVWCWGRPGESGMLGDGTSATRSTPAPVPGLADVTRVVATSWSLCALSAEGVVWCWGSNERGGLGVGSSEPNVGLPARVIGIDDAIDLAAGYNTVCAVQRGGSVLCWGRTNDEHSLGGTGGGVFVSSPSPVAGLAQVRAVAVGALFACALHDDGTVSCWGRNDRGQLGDGTTTPRVTPLRVSGLDGVVELAAGDRIACVRQREGTVACWGHVNDSQRVEDPHAPQLTPVAIEGITHAVELSVDARDVCVLLEGGDIRCWGVNAVGSVGDGTHESRSTPTPVRW